VAACFENHIADTQQWHTALLNRMTVPIPRICPAFISSETAALLNGLRGFWHFFRHAYGTNIDYEQLKINLDRARKINSNLEKDIEIFFQQWAET